ncbi:MAG: hypothetical protein IJ418_16485 [Clostridia bacterium]|nr:hypothetical protein [Clostridia bacterium]
MPAKKSEPIITHLEIYVLAINAIDAQINVWRQRCEGLPEDYFSKATEQLMLKRDALKELYRIEAGTEFV